MTRLCSLRFLILITAASVFLAPIGQVGAAVSLTDLSDWTRNPNNPIFEGNEFAGDPHVWEESPGNFRMLYTDSVDDHQAIAMATSTDLVNWNLISGSQYPNGVVLQGEGPGGQDPNLETAFYRQTGDGRHQIFYIGYVDEGTYHSAIYKAEASDIDGPYTREQDPIVTWTPDGADAQAMTSPTIAEHEGTLYMTYVGWEAYPDGPVSIIGATSTTDGRSWVKTDPLSWGDIFGVEAETVKGPDGIFYRVGIIADDQGGDVIALGSATHPFGPYTLLPDPILTPGGAGVGEGETIMSPTLLFEADARVAYVFYAAVDTGGRPWVISLATCDYGGG